ncbi:hypothetical protein F4778DRAFT_783598 [Xylariomycetidae sp. FL2044]|nr:hypothetical protein F4778DRAFT_783598 [Xylariomycetidae sp. FL2044]
MMYAATIPLGLFSGFFIGAQAVQYGLSTSSEDFPFQEDFERAMAAPNATGSYPVAGFDVTKPYPGEPIDGWTLDISVAAEIPTTPNGSEFVTGVGLQLKAPRALLTNASDVAGGVLPADNSTWRLCLMGFSSKLSGDANADGTCTGILDDDCISDLKSLATSIGSTYSQFACPNDLPSSCPTSDLMTGTHPLDERFTQTETYTVFSEAFQKGDQAQYDSLGAGVYPLVITWMHTSNVTSKAPLRENQVTVACAQANNITPGSETPSTASMSLASSRWAAGLVLVAGWMML